MKRTLFHPVLLLTAATVLHAQVPQRAEPPAPQPSPAVQRTLYELNQQLQTGHVLEALEEAQQVLAAAAQTRNAVDEALGHRARAIVLGELKRQADAAVAWQAAAAAWERAGDGPGQVEALAEAALQLASAGKNENAALLLERAVVLGGAEANRPLAAAAVMDATGAHYAGSGLAVRARSLFRSALEIRERLLPGSAEVANSLTNLGFEALARGDFMEAGGHFRRALTIWEKIAPSSLDVATSLAGAAEVARGQGDLLAARDLARRALAMHEKFAPVSPGLAYNLQVLSSIADSQGDPRTAMEYERRAVEVQQKLAPDSPAVAQNLGNLEILAHRLEDRAAEDEYHRRRTTLLEKLAAGRPEVPQPARTPSAVEEPPGPSPSADVGRLIGECEQRRSRGQEKEAYRAANAALALARHRKDLAGQAEALWSLSVVLEGSKRPAEAVTALREAAKLWERIGDGPGQVRALGRAGFLLDYTSEVARSLRARALAIATAEQKRPGAALTALGDWCSDEELDRLLPIAEQKVPNSRALAHLLNHMALTALMHQRMSEAQECNLRAIAIAASIGLLSPEAAEGFDMAASIALAVRHLADARGFYERELAILSRIAPYSVKVASTRVNLGNLSGSQGNWAAAVQEFRRALAIYDRLLPESVEVSQCLDSLGYAASNRGDLAEARAAYERVLRIREGRIHPDSESLAISLSALAATAERQGDLATARSCYQRALAIDEKARPEHPRRLGDPTIDAQWKRGDEDLHAFNRSAMLVNLGRVAEDQSDFDAALGYYRQALTIREKMSGPPEQNLLLASILNDVGGAADAVNDADTARACFERSLAIAESRLPDLGHDVAAASLNGLGLLAKRQGNLETARSYFHRALEVSQQLGPEGPGVANSLGNLGDIEFQCGKMDAAETQYRQALAIQDKHPAFSRRPMTLYRLGAVSQARGQSEQAEGYFRQAWGLVRREEASTTSDEARQTFQAAAAPYAAALAWVQLRLGKSAEAFATVEQGRAQALQQLLTERRVSERGAGGALWIEHEQALTGLRRVEEILGKADGARGAAKGALDAALRTAAPRETVSRLRTVADERERDFRTIEGDYLSQRNKVDLLWTRVKESAPRVFLQPSDLDATTRALPLDTLFAAFAEGSTQTALFLLSRGPYGRPLLRAYPIDGAGEALRARVQAFRDLVRNSGADPRDVAAAGRAMFAQLFPGPAGEAVQSAKRLLISPDGLLWEVPFAALVMNSSGAPQYLGTSKPLAFAQSLAVFKQSREGRPSAGSRRRLTALAVGDPVFDRRGALTASARSDSGERSYVYGGEGPPPRLPGTRVEAEKVAALYGGRALTGTAATEAAVRRLIVGADIIHLATHGTLHPTMAMSSGVLLTVPEKDPPPGETDNDGVLQAWEIFSQLKLKAELVVLSACETGRGRVVRSEGIVGMTRALQYAGARSVVASQWKVSDESTRDLMVAFHRRVRSGMAKDEALRQAMREVQSNPATASPYFWAAFMLTGDPDNVGLAATAHGSAHQLPGARRSAH